MEDRFLLFHEVFAPHLTVYDPDLLAIIKEGEKYKPNIPP